MNIKKMRITREDSEGWRSKIMTKTKREFDEKKNERKNWKKWREIDKRKKYLKKSEEDDNE